MRFRKLPVAVLVMLSVPAAFAQSEPPFGGATTCDLNSLVQEWGLVLGRAIFAQSRERPEEPGRMGVRPRPKITLARSAGRYYPPPIDIDEIPQPTCSPPTAECRGILEAP
jgi:hypothetical protein